MYQRTGKRKYAFACAAECRKARDVMEREEAVQTKLYDDAKVYGHARIYDWPKVYGNAEIYDHAEIFGDAEVYGDTKVCGDTKIDTWDVDAWGDENE